jgi:predicted nucleic acid-binding Zn ribbon protein
LSGAQPRRLSGALRAAREQAAPRTPLAAVQSRWREVAGETIAAEAEPVSEREGVVTIACRSATWAQELDLLQDEILRRLCQALPEYPPKALRFTADASRFST